MFATAVAVMAAIVQYAVPDVVPALQRDPDALAGGQWWRLVTPLLVQTLGWYQVLANLVTLALVGVVAERLLGRWRWLIVFFAGTVGGQVAAYAWHEPGGGDSIAICGLAGGVSVVLLAARTPVPKSATHLVIYYIVALTGWGFGGAFVAGLGCLAAGICVHTVRWVGLRDGERVVLAGAVVCALVLALAHDLHGVSLLSGMAVMLSSPGQPRPAIGSPPASGRWGEIMPRPARPARRTVSDR